MKKLFFLLGATAIMSVSLPAQTKLITTTGHAVIFSHTAAEDITANNYEVTGTINPATGEVAVSVPVQSFQFEKALMQEHFNSSQFMDSKQFPRISFKGSIENASAVNYSKDGKYLVMINGTITIKGTSKPITEKASIEIKEGKITVNSNLLVKEIGSYGVGKPKGSKKNNVADDIKVTFTGVYQTAE